MTKYVFIDYDGTFANGSVVPPEHVDAVRRARAAGHRVLLCTGRPRCMFPDDIAEDFDGIVALAGGYVELDGEVLMDTVFPAEVAREAQRLLTEHDVVYTLESATGLRSPADRAERLREMARQNGDPRSAFTEVIDALVVDDGPAEFGKVMCWASSVPVAEIGAALGPLVASIPTSLPGLVGNAGELYLAGITKAVGVDAVVRARGISADDIVAIGDGYNDLEMLQYAGTAVVVEGAPPAILAEADLIVGRPDDHGVLRAFEQLALI